MKCEWIIPTEIWNHAARALWRMRPRRGTYCLLHELSDGTLISADPAASWQHPWFTIPKWNGEAWTATVKPGFVNEWDPVVPGRRDLIDAPVMPLAEFRSLPSERDPLPPFFKALGVEDFIEGVSVDDLGNIIVKERPAPTLPPRALVAMDFFVAVARATYEGQVTITDQSGVTGQVVDYYVTYNSDQLQRVGSRPRLLQAARYEPVKAPTLAERMLGQFLDDSEDRILISTVYLLSPPNKMEGPPDLTWTPFVQHGQFWNLCHRPRNVVPSKPPPPVRLYTGLLGGWADLIFNQLLSPLNELSQVVANAVNTTNNAGKFWSA